MCIGTRSPHNLESLYSGTSTDIGHLGHVAMYQQILLVKHCVIKNLYFSGHLSILDNGQIQVPKMQ